MSGLLNRDGSLKVPSSRPGRISISDHMLGRLKRLFVRLDRNDPISLQEYEQMWTSDETIRAGLEFTQLSVCSHMGEYKHEDNQIQSFVRANLAGMKKSFAQVIRELTSAFVYGYAVGERIARIDNNQAWLHDVAFLDPKTIVGFNRFESERSPNFGEIQEVLQRPRTVTGLARPISIPIEKCLHYSHNGYFDNPWGISRLRPVWQVWYLKRIIQEAYGRALQRYGTPLTVGKTSNPGSLAGGSEDDQTKGQAMMAAIEALKDCMAIVVDSKEDIEFTEAPHFGKTFIEALRYLDSLLLRSVLSPDLLFNPSSASETMSASKFEVFARFVSCTAEEVADLVLKQLVGPVIWWNFGPDVPLGRFGIQFLDEAKTRLWSQTVFALVRAGIVNPRRREDLNTLRKIFGLDPVSEEEFPEFLASLPEGMIGSSEGLPGGQAPGGEEPSSDGNPRPGGRTPGDPQGRPREADTDDEDEE